MSVNCTHKHKSTGFGFRALLALALLAGFSLLPVRAEQLVLVHGYLGKPANWAEAGVVRVLTQRGWRFGGEFYHASDGVRLYQPDPNVGNARRQFYHVVLPTEAPVHIQAYYLNAYLNKLRQRYPDDQLTLVGHSAGGVVARYTMVKNPDLNVDRLITIASPHLGTDSAALGKLVGDSPLGVIAPWVGAGTLSRSKGLYADLSPEQQNRMLYRLNRQPHPPAEYISIVRDQQADMGGDWVVSQHSQYLERVAALRGRAFSYVVPSAHGLTAADGWLIADMLEEKTVKPL